jgi:hypothetical protein
MAASAGGGCAEASRGTSKITARSTSEAMMIRKIIRPLGVGRNSFVMGHHGTGSNFVPDISPAKWWPTRSQWRQG